MNSRNFINWYDWCGITKLKGKLVEKSAKVEVPKRLNRLRILIEGFSYELERKNLSDVERLELERSIQLYTNEIDLIDRAFFGNKR